MSASEQTVRTRRRPPRRRLAWALGVLASLLVATLPQASAAARARSDKVDPAVLAQLGAADEATFWAVLSAKADLDPGSDIDDRAARGTFVVDELVKVADASQEGLVARLDELGVPYEPFWVVNAVKITADDAVLAEVAARPDVERVVADEVFEIPEPLPGAEEQAVQSVEWNIDRIGAPLVWSTFGVRGEGIVVANIDTGVQFDHPALRAQYRGNLGGGVVSHDYNWFDPSEVCGDPSLAPCDNVGHGTHTMGTMVGDDGDPGGNQIGVAPHAKWIAAKGCETSSCTLSALLAAGQWVLAPTDLAGANPRPDLRPHIVNSSWGGTPGNLFYQATVDAWIASGIFPVFSNGNGGPNCATSSSPGDYSTTYSAGAFDVNGNIAGFSSRGPSAFGGELKPNIAAPGVNVRSAWRDSTYRSASGTSMASPHVAGTVALMWSAAPAIVGDIAATRALLDSTAIDAPGVACGGTDGDNNVFGEGRLDAFAALDQSPRRGTGTLTGTVTYGETGTPAAGARVEAAGAVTRAATTNSSGVYVLTVPAGRYDVAARQFGFRTALVPGVEVQDGVTTTADLSFQRAPVHDVSGHVRDEGQPTAGATVTILDTPFSQVTGAAGDYLFTDVPEGDYDVRVEAGQCAAPQTQHLVVDGNELLDFDLTRRYDGFGYFCRDVPADYIVASDNLVLSGDDASTSVPLPFSFPFYGRFYSTVHVSTNGSLNFLAANTTFANTQIPATAAPNAAVYPFWDDLFVDNPTAGVHTQLIGSAPTRRFVIEWRNVRFVGGNDTARRVDFEVVLHENGHIVVQYRNLSAVPADIRERGSSATVGIENESGTVALQHSFNMAVLMAPTFAVLYRLPPSGFIEGVVIDANDRLPVIGATVQVLQNDIAIRQATTDASGHYRVHVPLGSYDLQVAKTNYGTETVALAIDQEDQTVTANLSLRTARGEVSPAALRLLVPPSQTRSATLTVRNDGSRDMAWAVGETVGDTTPAIAGRVLRSWTPTGVSSPTGVGYTGNVWISDAPNDHNYEFGVDGVSSGPLRDAAPWVEPGSPDDMAYDSRHGLMCQVRTGGTNAIYCWQPDTGLVVDSITGAWAANSQHGLAYRADDDTFYVGGLTDRTIYHINGLSHPDSGTIIGRCAPPDGAITGLAYNPSFDVVWVATDTPSDTIYQLDFDGCAVRGTLRHPSPGSDSAGLEIDAVGNLWMVDQDPATAYLLDSGLPVFEDVPWLAQSPASGTLAPGASQSIEVSVDSTGVAPGVYGVTLYLVTNSARHELLRVPVDVVVSAYDQAADAGGAGYTDLAGDTWAPDRPFTPGSWGYTARTSRVVITTKAIAGTDDDALYRTARQDPIEYRFDGIPPGVYEVDLRFAEVANRRPGRRMYDVIVENINVLPAHDIAGEVGTLNADHHVFSVPVTDGQLNIRFVTRRGFDRPIVSGIHVTHRPDRKPTDPSPGPR